ncbi:MAG: phosphoribosylformylglycinamidine cyclo-ligase [Chloroflexota bacterium]
MAKTTTYKDAGVDIDAGNELVDRIGAIVKPTMRPEVVGSIGGFGALFSLAKTPYKKPVLVSSTDGVGTKLKIAFMTGIHDTVGIDLVAMCVNDILTQGAAPLFFLDYFACGKLDVKIATAVVRGIAAGCRQAGCALIGGETAEHPGDFPKGEYDLAGFVVGVLERKKIIDAAAIVAGDILLGVPSSGLHSNGYSLARKVLLEKGRLKLGQRISELGRTLAEELLEPTRIYTRLTRRLFARHSIKGAAHITGGGITGNLPRVLPKGRRAVIERGSWPVPPVFELIKKIGAVEQEEMDHTFNNGLGLILVVDHRHADAVRRTLKQIGEKSFVIGAVCNGARGARISP